MLGCKPASVPMEPDKKFRTDSRRNGDKDKKFRTDSGDEMVTKEGIREEKRLVGKLIYLAHTRPYIGFVVGMVNIPDVGINLIMTGLNMLRLTYAPSNFQITIFLPRHFQRASLMP